MKGTRILVATLLAGGLVAGAGRCDASVPAGPPGDRDIVDAYHYMLGRWLVLRQESSDLRNGLKWNELVHRTPGAVTGANPNLDVAMSDAWMYIDETSCTMIELPEIKGLYYTVEFVNGWGEVMDNVNERRNPKHPFGKFAMCVRDAKMSFPPEVRRLNLPNRKSRVIVSIELGPDPAPTIALQKRLRMKATGTPKIPKGVVEPSFTNDKLPGVEAFDRTEAILASEPDINAGGEFLQATGVIQARARAVAKAAADPKQRARIDEVIRKQAIPEFLAAIPKQGAEINGWSRPRLVGMYGSDFLTRSIVNFTSLWANNARESLSFLRSGLDGGETYIQIFANTVPPHKMAKYSWSVTAVDSAKKQVLPNSLRRHALSERSTLKYNPDGSLMLAFAPTKPEGIPESNWLPTVAGTKYDLTYRFYGAAREVGAGNAYPPPLTAAKK